MRVEPATTDDVDALVDAWVALVGTQRRHGSRLKADANRAAVRPLLAYHVVEGTVLVAREGPGADDRDARAGDGDAIVGFVNFGLEDAGLEADGVRGVIHNVFVDPAARDEGVGSALLDAAEEALAERGADVIAIEALADNDAARRLYERRGYRPHRIQYERTTESDRSQSE